MSEAEIKTEPLEEAPKLTEAEIVAKMGNDEAVALLFNWEKWALPKQLPPEGDWTTWLLMGGRGSGKTRAGAEWVRTLARERVSPIALVGETMTEAINIMLLGIPGDNTYANLAEANRALWRQTLVPLVVRVSQELTGWLGPAFEGAALVPDFDKVEALAEDRAALWARVGSADFLSDAEKREMVGVTLAKHT